MGNIHHRVNMVLITYLVMAAMSAHECLTQSTDSSDILMESTSDGQSG